MRIGELFAGYGGLGMGVQTVMGGSVAWVSDIDKGANKILAHRFPSIPNIGDITTVKWVPDCPVELGGCGRPAEVLADRTGWQCHHCQMLWPTSLGKVYWPEVPEPVDVLCGGSPCQDLSHAGKRQGMTEGTRSNLWVAMREAIAQLRPRYVIWENVRGAYSAEADSELESDARLLAGTRRRDGEPVLRALGRVLGDLSDLGYDCRWHGLRAADVGAPHGRFRVFVVATDAECRGRDGWAPDALRGSLDGASAAGGGEVAGSPTDAADLGHERARRARDGWPGPADGGLLPTPRATDGTKGGPNQRGSSGDLMLPRAVALLGTPTSRDWKDGGPQANVPINGLLGRQVWALLPTPAVNDMGAGKTVEDWDAWTDDMKARHGNGNGHGKSLAIEAQRLLPTPKATNNENQCSEGWDNLATALQEIVPDLRLLGQKSNPLKQENGDEGLRDSGTGQDVRGVRGDIQPEALQRNAGKHEPLPDEALLWPVVREHEADSDEGRSPLAGTEAQGFDLPGLRVDGEAARSPRRPEPREQRPGEPDHSLRELPPETPLAGGSRQTGIRDEAAARSSVCDLRGDVSPAVGEDADVLDPVQAATGKPTEDRVLSAQSWGVYEAAIRRWEVCLGRVAPPPTILSARGTAQLSPRFVEFLMGVPAGWVTDVPGITRNEALKALGNGVVKQQAVAALRTMLAWEAVAS